MSSEAIIVCEDCGSYKVEKLPKNKLPRKPLLKKIASMFVLTPYIRHSWQAGTYLCSVCGHTFEVTNPDEYCLKTPPDKERCINCDKIGRIILIEKNYKSEHQPKEEITDLYQCSSCHQKILHFVQKAPYVLYD